MSKGCSSDRNSSGVNLICRNILIARVEKPMPPKKYSVWSFESDYVRACPPRFGVNDIKSTYLPSGRNWTSGIES
jgi:hypothetical protein